MQSLARTFARLESRLPGALVSDAARRRLMAKAATLPAALSQCVYVECHPDNPDSADLIVDVGAPGFAILAGANPHLAPASPRLASPAWSRVTALARIWASAGSPLRERIDGMWLEFDLEDENAADAPSLFVDFSPAVYHAESIAARVDPLTEVARFVNRPFDRMQRQAIHDLIARLPRHAVLLYAGFMLARHSDAVRLCIMGLTRLELASFLRGAQWHGDIDGVMALVDGIAEPAGGGQRQPAIVHIDVDTGGHAARGSSVGLEYPLSRQSQVAGTFTEVALLDMLVSRGMLTPAQRSDLEAWPGYERVTLPHELWPSILTRRVNHVKLVQPPGGAATVKLYLCAEQRLAPSNRASAASSG